jgi:serine protease inhibitor
MHTDDAALFSGNGYAGARLPYRHGGLTATVVLPDGSLSDFVAGLTPATLAAILTAPTTNGELALPRISTSPQPQDLRATLSAMGMPSAFDASRADLGGLAPNTYVEQLVQGAGLDVTEAGTTAAAVTAAAISPTALVNRRLAVDRPFLFLITDASGAVVFASEITDPSR